MHTNYDLVVFLCMFNISGDYSRYLRVGITHNGDLVVFLNISIFREITLDISGLVLHTNDDLVVFPCISNISVNYIRYLRVDNTYK